MIENSNEALFYLDPFVIDTHTVKKIGIDKSTNSIIVEVGDNFILQSININSFSEGTIKPLKKQLNDILFYLQDREKKIIINSIITCVNKNIEKIYEHCKKDDNNETILDENDKVANLIDLALSSENLEKLFKNQYGKPFAAVRLGNDKHLETMATDGIKYKRYLAKLCRSNIGCCISDGLLNTVITNLSAEAESSDEVIPLHLRVAWGSQANRCEYDCIYYDMCDSKKIIIEISKKGWRTIEGFDPVIPILFRQYNQQPQVEPNRNYPSDIFDQLLNLTNVKSSNHRHLLKVYIISILIPEIDHVILTTYGAKGAAKSFLLELIKKLVDPTKPTLLTLHRNIDQFIQQINHNYINYYDNVKYIPYWLSDEICKAVTGIGHTKRQHYTDDEDIIYEHKRPIGLNGINVALTEPDALDRSISVELKEIDDEHRKKEADLWKEFEGIKPQVFGYILDTIVKAMQIKAALNLKKLPRMADFAEWGEAISQAMGYPPMSFMKVYAENRNELNIVAVDESLVGSLFLKYISDIESQYGPITEKQFEPQELYKNLVDFAEDNDIAIGGRYFPKDAGNLVKKLKTVAPNLKTGYGIIIDVGRNTATNTSVITVSRTASVENKYDSSSGTSEPPEANYKTSMNTNDRQNIENIVSTNNGSKDDPDDSTASIDINKGIEIPGKHGSLMRSNSLKDPPEIKMDNWVAFDFEWTVTNSNKSPICRIDENASEGSEAPVVDKNEYSEIVTFAYDDSVGNRGCLDITDFDSTKSFLETIKKKLLSYSYCFAWGSKSIVRKDIETGQLEGVNGDLTVLNSNLKANKISSIVKYDKYSYIPFLKGDTFTAGKIQLIADIDLLRVFTKPLVRTSIFKNKYKSLRLDDVSQSLLGYGKLDNKSGAKVDEMSIDERKSYCLRDAHLVAELIRIKNGDILRIMDVIARHTGLKFEEVCHKGMTSLWKKIINEAISKKIRIVGYEHIPAVLHKLYSNNSNGTYSDHFENEYDKDEELLEYKENSFDQYADLLDQNVRNRNSNTIDDDNVLHGFYLNDKSIRKDNVKPIVKNKYKGGLVLSPLRGLHQDVYLFDITSLYPTMIINYNISPETINCSCCRDNVKARLILDKDIQNHFQHNIGNKNNDHNYWICKRRKGLFSKILQELTEKRIQYKNKGMELESTAIKAIINSGYGVFGHPNFKYYEPRVAEVITALGRQTLLEMNKIAEEIGFAVLYGDTDSIFVNNIKSIDIPRFIDNCKTRLNVNVNHEKTFRKLILVGKKHYIGILYGDEEQPIIKGMEGIKSDRPEFIQTTFIEMIKDIQNNVSPIPNLRQRFEELDGRQIPKERLSISLVLTKNPIDYTHDDKQKRLGVKLGLKKGDTFTYYKCDKQEFANDSFGKEKTRTVSESDSPADISFAKYKEMLLNSVKDVIEILGYSIEKDLLSKKKWLNLSADN